MLKLEMMKNAHSDSISSRPASVHGWLKSTLRRSKTLSSLYGYLRQNVLGPTPPFVASGCIWKARSILSPILTLPCVVQLHNGMKLRLSNDALDERILCGVYGQYRDLYFPPLMAGVPYGGVILEIGAHHGIFTAAALHRYQHAHIITVEPNPDALPCIQANLKINGLESRASIVCAAVGNTDGEASLVRSKEGSWGDHLAEPNTQGGERVKTLTIKTILEGQKPYFVKCNAEGGEYDAIPQLFDLGMRPAFISLFLHPDQGDWMALLRLVETNGYAVTPVCSDPSHPRYLCVHRSAG